MQTVAAKVCRVTIVDPGRSDAVLKIYPAEHDSEKIWLSEVKGIERWEMIQRNMNAFAEKGTRVPKPVPYHNDPRNLSTITLKEDDIPTVKMEGWTLPKPPEEEKAPTYRTDANNPMAINQRIDRMDSTLAYLAQAMAAMTAGKEYKTESPAPVKSEFSCCEKSFANQTGLDVHKRRMHKEA